MAKLKYAYDKIKRKVFIDFWKIKKSEDFFSGKMTDLQFFLGLFSLPEKGHAVIQAMLAHWMKKGVLESKDGVYHFPGETPALSLREVFPKPKVETPTEENPANAIGETLDLLDTLHLVHHHRDRARLSVGEDTLLFTKEFKDFVGRMRYLNPVPDGPSPANLSQAEKKFLARIYESLYFHEPGNAEMLESLVKKEALYYGFDATHRAAFVAPEKKESPKGAGDSALIYAGAEAPALFLSALEGRMTGEKSPRKKNEENPYEGFRWYRDPDFIETLARKLVSHPKGKRFLRWSPVRKYRFLLDEIYPGLLSFMKRLYRVFGKEGALSVSTLPRRFRMLQIQKGFQAKPGALEVEGGLKLLREINLLVKEGESYGRHRPLWKKILVGKKLAGAKSAAAKMDRLIFDSDLQITAYRSTLTPGLLYELLALTRVKHGDHHLSFQLLPEKAAHYLALGHGPGRAEKLLKREARETWSEAASEHLRLLFGSADFVRTGVRHILHTWSPSFFQRLRFLLEGAGIPFLTEEAGAAKNFVFMKGSDYRKARELLRRNGIFSG